MMIIRAALAAALALGILAAPLAAKAQQARKVYRIGVLEVVPVVSNSTNLSAFRQGLRELGYVSERDIKAHSGKLLPQGRRGQPARDSPGNGRSYRWDERRQETARLSQCAAATVTAARGPETQPAGLSRERFRSRRTPFEQISTEASVGANDQARTPAVELTSRGLRAGGSESVTLSCDYEDR